MKGRAVEHIKSMERHVPIACAPSCIVWGIYMSYTQDVHKNEYFENKDKYIDLCAIIIKNSQYVIMCKSESFLAYSHANWFEH